MSLGITFGICTYNRKDILLKSARSLNQVDRKDELHIRIYDDCSSDYGADFLRQLFPSAYTVKTHMSNVGSDANIASMFKDFLNYDDDILFNADSDLIYNKGLIDRIYSVMPDSDGLVSLLNVPSHRTIGEYGEEYVIKENVGSAGCCVSRELVQKIVDNVRETDKSFDYNLCKYLNTEGIKVLAVKNSAVQHIGVTGQNTDFFSFDYGNGFLCDNLDNASIIEETFEEYINSMQRFKDSSLGKIIHVMVAVDRRIKRILKK